MRHLTNNQEQPDREPMVTVWGEKRVYPIGQSIGASLSPKILGVIAVIFLLSTLDAIFTLVLVESGARELNPIMAYYLNRSPLIFFGIKYLLTGGSVLLIVVHRNAFLFKTKVRAKFLLIAIAIPFALVIQWELYLIFFYL